jgi:hypothetical protein
MGEALQKKRHFEENLARQVSTTKEEEMRLKSTHFQTKEEEVAPSPKYGIPSFRKPPPLQEPIVVTPPLPMQKRWPHEASIPVTISLFEGGPFIWTLDDTNMEFWEKKMEKIEQQREELQPTEENKEVAIKKKEDDPILLFEELPSFVEEEEEEKVVPSLKEQIMAFEPLQVNEDLL